MAAMLCKLQAMMHQMDGSVGACEAGDGDDDEQELSGSRKARAHRGLAGLAKPHRFESV